MADEKGLDEPITTSSLTAETKLELLNNLFQPNISAEKLESKDCESYLQYYADQCCEYYYEQRNLAMQRGETHAPVETHRDILRVVQPVKVATWSYPLGAFPGQDAAMRPPINLAARLLTMIRLGDPQYGFIGQNAPVWNNGTLSSFVGRHFGPSVMKEHVKLERIFNVRNLERLAGLEIKWTDNLADHLRLFNDDKNVAIFHHAAFLEIAPSHLFPTGFIDETLRTLALLLPSSDKGTRTWFQKQQSLSSRRLDSGAIKCKRLKADDRQIDNFCFWRDRLVILKLLFDEAEPSTISQWWYDRRKGPQWYTFWVAIVVVLLTVFFGLVQSIEGALQVYKAYHPERS